MEDDKSLHWFQKPHTLTVLLICGIVLVIGAFTREADTQTNIKFGACAAAVVFLVFCMLYLHDGPFTRPHPAVWRIITGIGILYLLGMVALLFQNVDDVRAFLKWFDPNLGKPLPERSYADQCELYTPDDPVSSFRNLMDTVNDEFILAHLFGWFGKALLLRDTYLCFFMSLLFEVLEYTLEHQLANFAECWWDHLILDIIVCNTIGIMSGMWVCRNLLKMKEYDWTGLWTGTKKGKVMRAFTPAWSEYHWDFLHNWKRFASVLLVIVSISIVELNAFYLKFILWVPPPHPLNVGRLILWMAIGMPGLREFYQFVSDPKCHKMGTMSWLIVNMFIMEALVCIKLGRGMFPNPTPPHIFWPWLIFLVVGGIWTVVYFSYKSVKGQEIADRKRGNKHNKKKQ
eukprot:TRINITY_DN4708_c0_g1_i1.p1 TRINITY_DN4708_c0_g1~~TRINITY_DN4708_c0_g1_i1.p1  ORF type:complete len:448 (-),score=75.30 TRINITY_DN4708_c0_g1_i1:178-1377(-)